MAGNNGSKLVFYEADSGETHVMRINEVSETLSIAGTPQALVAGPATSPFWAEITRGSTEYGLKPRKVNICFTVDPVDTSLEQGSTYEIVVFSPATFAALTLNLDVEYQGFAAKVVGKSPENIYPGI